MKFPIYMEKNNPNVPKHQPVINHRSFAKRCLPDCSWLRFPPNHTLELGSWEYKIGFLPSPHHVATPRLKFKSSVFSHFRIHFRIIIRSGKKNNMFFWNMDPESAETIWCGHKMGLFAGSFILLHPQVCCCGAKIWTCPKWSKCKQSCIDDFPCKRRQSSRVELQENSTLVTNLPIKHGDFP